MNVFKEISVGGLAKTQLIKRLVDAGIQFNKYAHVLFEHSAFSPTDKAVQIKLVRIKLSELGISTPSTFQIIVTKASEADLKLCPLFLGAFLRLEYLDQTEDPYLTVASAKPETDENFPNGFYLRNFDHSLWLRGYRASNDYEHAIDSEFVFQL
jgi:hypothetical protein